MSVGEGKRQLRMVDGGCGIFKQCDCFVSIMALFGVSEMTKCMAAPCKRRNRNYGPRWKQRCAICMSGTRSFAGLVPQRSVSSIGGTIEEVNASVANVGQASLATGAANGHRTAESFHGRRQYRALLITADRDPAAANRGERRDPTDGDWRPWLTWI
mmetsp:Transcript_26391/g.37833  ORF Transcript_26391/g.37833 Transcript_26391/m.37833 type:complete len:157 (+) Transcript_26391:691-1161(+)